MSDSVATDSITLTRVDDGADGISPTVTTSKSGTTTTISITDATGVKTATIKDGTGIRDNILIGTKHWENGWGKGTNSKETYKGMDVLSVTTTSASYTDIYQFPEETAFEYKLLPSTEYTLSFYAKASEQCDIVSYLYPNVVADGSDGHTTSTIGTEWKRCVVHWKTAESRTTNARVIVARILQKPNITLYLAGAKLEEGTEASEWSQAPSELADSTMFATCSTEAATAAKVATLSSGSFALTEGRTVTVTFTNGNTASSPTLNVAGTGAKAMKCQGSTVVSISAGASVSFTYHSNVWYVSSEPVYGSTATIGNSQSKNVYIDSNGVNIKNGSTALASFTPSAISLGNNSKESTISMMGGAIKLIAKKVNDTITLNDLVSSPAIRISDKASGESGSALAPAITVGGEDVVIQGYNGGGYPVMINGAYYQKKISTTVTCSYGLSVTFTRIGQMVEAVCNAKTTATIPVNSAKITLCTIPYHYRPAGAAYTVKSYQAALGFIEVGVESTSITLGWYRTENGSTAQMSTYPSGNWLRFHELWLTYDS